MKKKLILKTSFGDIEFTHSELRQLIFHVEMRHRFEFSSDYSYIFENQGKLLIPGLLDVS